MEKNPIAWGLDIGQSSVKAVKLQRSGDDVNILGYAIEPIVVVGEDGNRDEAVVKALTALTTREEFGGLPVVASLSGRQIFTRTINIPVINPKTVDRMVELEARQQIPGNFDEIEWSYHLSPAPDGTSNDVAIFAARKDLIADLVAKCKQVGINLVGVSVTSLALYNFVRFDQEFPEDETVVILDVGAENTDLVLYQGETLWMRSLPVSGSDITKAFMKKFRVSFEEAETLKRQISESRQADKILKVIEGSLNELVSEVQRSLGFYKQTNPNAKLENVVISGNTFRLPNMAQYIADRLRYAVISLEDLERVHVANGLDREHFLNDLQSLGVAMGLALQGVGVSKARVNLLPTEERIERIMREKRWAGVAVLALLLVTWGVHYLVVQSVIDRNVEIITAIKSAYKTNDEAERDSRAVLELAGPYAQTLAGFDSYGDHKGVNHAVIEAVFAIVQDIIKDSGPLNPDAPRTKPEDGNDPHLQQVYLRSIDIPSFNFRNDPFRPLNEVRKVKIEIGVVEKGKDVRLVIENRLKEAPVPDALKAVHGGTKLFSGVQNAGQQPGSEDYYVKDEAFRLEGGDIKPLDKQFNPPLKIYVFECALGGKEVAK